MKKLNLLFIMLVVLSGCIGEEKHQYSGNSESWSMTYEVVAAKSGSQQVEGAINYTGAGSAPEMINYSIGTILKSQSATGMPAKDGVVTLDSGRCLDCGIIQEHSPIQVEITWDGQTETFSLMEE
ncbi:hypothetical protein [Planococcus sp. ISL-109]|uniref:hypothetical protein n=1 Tax=Planococcus sp. ISL-109 TaxID=2819166 RepID=UPI001BEBF020|nr:hypothetical protein [Planococcus sp. ISL-109]MBT2581259.1 hypothetical protein [Planococcus sp. ISL-109]